MKKIYERVEIQLIFFGKEDVVRTSQNDNLGTLPDFPENPENFTN